MHSKKKFQDNKIEIIAWSTVIGDMVIGLKLNINNKFSSSFEKNLEEKILGEKNSKKYFLGALSSQARPLHLTCSSPKAHTLLVLIVMLM